MPLGGDSSGGSAGAVRAGRAFVELFLEDGPLVRKLNGIRDRFAGFAKSLKGVGIGAGAAGAGIFAGLGLGGKTAIESLTDTAKLGAVADAFGLSAERASRLFGILAAGGSDIRDATEGIATFGQRVSDAVEGKGEEAAELFQKLGVGAQKFAGLKPDEQFFKLIRALREVKDPATRVQLLLKAVGEDTGKNLIPLLSLSDAQLQKLGDSFELTADQIQKSREASFAFTVAVAQLKQILTAIAVSVAPAFKSAADVLASVAQPISRIIQQFPGAVTGLVAVAAAGGVLATGLAGAVAAVGLLGFGIGGLSAALVAAPFVAKFAAIGAAATVAAVAVGGLAYALATKTEPGKAAVKLLGDAFSSLAETFGKVWKGILDALQGGSLGKAAEIAFQGLMVEFNKLAAFVTQKFAAVGNNLRNLPLSVIPNWLLDFFPTDNSVVARRQATRASQKQLQDLLDQAADLKNAARAPNRLEVSDSFGQAVGAAKAVRSAFSTFGIASQIFGGNGGMGMGDKIKKAIDNNGKKLDEIKKAIVDTSGLRFS